MVAYSGFDKAAESVRDRESTGEYFFWLKSRRLREKGNRKHIAGIRLVNGRYQYIKDNDAAAPDCDLSRDSKERADVLIDGKPLKVSVEDGEITILATNEETGKEYGGDEWQNVGIDLEPIPDFVKALGIILEEHEELNKGAKKGLAPKLPTHTQAPREKTLKRISLIHYTCIYVFLQVERWGNGGNWLLFGWRYKVYGPLLSMCLSRLLASLLECDNHIALP